MSFTIQGRFNAKISAELILFTTARIETDAGSVGTAFIVTDEGLGPSSGDHLPFLVTNKHLLEGSSKASILLSTASGNEAQYDPRPVHIAEDLSALWTGHPNEKVDVSILPLAPVLNRLHEADNELKLHYQPISLSSAIPNDDQYKEIGLIEDIPFVGYPSGIHDSSHNLPVARRGLSATPYTVDYEGDPVFLIDASVFPGSSGSPVFLYNIGNWRSNQASVAGDRVLFLGVLSSVFYREEDGTIKARDVPTRVEPYVETKQMIDLGVVYKSRTVRETITHFLSFLPKSFSSLAPGT